MTYMVVSPSLHLFQTHQVATPTSRMSNTVELRWECASCQFCVKKSTQGYNLQGDVHYLPTTEENILGKWGFGLASIEPYSFNTKPKHIHFKLVSTPTNGKVKFIRHSMQTMKLCMWLIRKPKDDNGTLERVAQSGFPLPLPPIHHWITDPCWLR